MRHSVFRFLRVILPALALCLAFQSRADSVTARCDVFPLGEDRASSSGPCVFSQRQGYVTIRRDDGVTHSLAPVADVAGNFTDANGDPVYRTSGLGDAGLIFRFPRESVFVYWRMAADQAGADDDNPTAPYTTDDYDATTLLPCRLLTDSEMGSCPAGILRMEDGQASIVVTSPGGEEFTFNFMREYVNATNRTVEATLERDMWRVTVNGSEEYRVPVAAIEGG
jgi:hypothetical protein